MDTATESTDSIVERIRSSADVKLKMEISGLIRHPSNDGDIKQHCANCIYFLPNAAFCDMPELEFPVQADWWCRLWRM
jgi:hypothetical protein